MFLAIVIGFLITFAMTVIHKKRDGPKVLLDEMSPFQPRVIMSNASYGSVSRQALEQGYGGPKSITYCVIDGRMIDRDGPNSNISLLQ